MPSQAHEITAARRVGPFRMASEPCVVLSRVAIGGGARAYFFFADEMCRQCQGRR